MALFPLDYEHNPGKYIPQYNHECICITPAVQMTAVVLVESVNSPYSIALKECNQICTTHICNNTKDLVTFLENNFDSIDVVVLDLIIDSDSMTMQRSRAGLELDGLLMTKTIIERWPSIKIVVLSRFWHSRNVIAAYRYGVRCFIKRNYIVYANFLDKIISVARGEIVEPKDFDLDTNNRVRLLLDERLCSLTPANQDLLFLMLIGCDTEEMARLLGHPTKQPLYNKLSQIYSATGFDRRSDFIEY